MRNLNEKFEWYIFNSLVVDLGERSNKNRMVDIQGENGRRDLLAREKKLDFPFLFRQHGCE